MPTISDTNPALAELDSLCGGQISPPSPERGAIELEQLLGSYTGSLSVSNATAHFNRHQKPPAYGPWGSTEAYQEIWLPFPYAAQTGEATWVVSTALILRLLSEHQDGATRTRLLQSAECYTSFERSAPAIRDFSELASELAAKEAAVSELWALLRSHPGKATEDAEAYLERIAAGHRSVREGSDYNRHIQIAYPEHVQTPGKTTGMTLPVGLALHLVAAHAEAHDPRYAAKLLTLADSYYVDSDLEIEVRFPDGETLSLYDLEHVSLTEARALVERCKGAQLTGSAQIRQYTGGSCYSPDPLKFEYSLFRYWHGEDPENPEDRAELYLLVSDQRAYKAVARRD